MKPAIQLAQPPPSLLNRNKPTIPITVQMRRNDGRAYVFPRAGFMAPPVRLPATPKSYGDSAESSAREQCRVNITQPDSAKALYRVDMKLPSGGRPLGSGYLQPGPLMVHKERVPHTL